uniref:LP1G.08 n=1 Tax=Lysinibacillus sphaericus TaxID=1421 RepID=Q7WYM3_LYSSH|nr:hypothetical protein [Lysinibacillus sphaericus]AAP86225.1 LP1G.08 [Lysinibacillus sphaericus]
MRFLLNYKMVFLSALLLSFLYVPNAHAADACDYKNGILDSVSADTTSSNGAANFRKIFDNDVNSYATVGNQDNHNIIILDDVVNIEALKEVTNLTAIPTAQDVSLKWKMPEYKELEKARIYRQKTDVGLFVRMFRSASTYEPLFETNGTTFKDLTVKADTEYTYKVTTVDTNDNESEGKTIKIRTKKMSVSGGGTEKDENGDYTITWTSPTTGKIKVLVGGKEYAVVSASDKKIVIPKNKMEFDILGNPDVQLIPIDEDGNEGLPSKPGAGEGTGNGGGIGDIVGGSDLADLLSPSNLLKAGMGLVALVGSILLIRMAFILAPKLIRLIRNALKKEKDVNVYVRRGVRE